MVLIFALVCSSAATTEGMLRRAEFDRPFAAVGEPSAAFGAVVAFAVAGVAVVEPADSESSNAPPLRTGLASIDDREAVWRKAKSFEELF